MDSVDLDTQLPPRKRLLAGFRKENCDIEVSLPDSKVFDNLRSLLSLKSSSKDEILEASRLAASAATEAAAAARALAIEKAEAAVKAKEAAKRALDLLASVSGNEGCDEGSIKHKPKLKKKHVPIKLLYKNHLSEGRKDNDEELARIMHQSMNSSPRIRHSVNAPVLCARNAQLSGHPLGESEGQLIVCDNGGLVCSKDTNCQRNGKKVKIKRRKLLISECNAKDRGAQQESSLNKKTDNENKVPLKITSMLRCKKIKVSHCSSDSKMLPSPCLSPAPAETSATLKVD